MDSSVFASASGRHLIASAFRQQKRLCLESVLLGIDHKGSVGDIDPAAVVILIIEGFDPVGLTGNVVRSSENDHRILAADPVLHTVDRDGSACQDQTVLGIDPIVEVCVDSKASVSVDDQIILGIKRRVRFFLGRIIINVLGAVGQDIFASLRQRHRDGLCQDPIDRCTVLAGDGHAVQNQPHIRFLIRIHYDLSV